MLCTQQYYRDFRSGYRARPTVGYPLTPDLRLSLGYTIENIEIPKLAPCTLPGGRDRRYQLGASIRLYPDTRNNRLFPTSDSITA